MPDTTFARHARWAAPRVAQNSVRTQPRPVSRSVDVALAVIFGALTLPVVLFAALLVWVTSRGPVLYTQVRAGQNGRLFRIWKLRSMRHNCEAGTGARWAAGHADPRITPVGRVLRKLHVDELPQLWNVLKGDMALVGPRPERPEILDGLEIGLPGVRLRLAVLPGLTGLAQIQLPADQTLGCFRRKLALDLVYARHQSVWLDVRILFGTVFYLAGVPYALVARLAGLPVHAPTPTVTDNTAEVAALGTADHNELSAPTLVRA